MKLVPIGECVEKVSSWNPVRDAPDEKIAYVDLGAVDNEHKVIREPQSVLGRDAPSRARQKLNAGDILVSTVRPYLNGVAKVPERLAGSTGSTGFCVLRPCSGKIDRSYLFQWLTASSFIDDMVRKSTGASYPAVSDRIIHESLVPLPSLPEQQRIAAILDQADEVRRLRRKALKRLSELGRAIFFQMFGDVRSNERQWPERLLLQDVADIASGITKGRKLNGQSTRAIPYMTVATVQDGHLKLDDVKTIEATEREIERYRLQKGDILLTEGGDPDKLGRGTMWEDEIAECIHQNHVFRVRVTDPRLNPIFATWLIGSPRGKAYFLRAAKQTTGIASINSTQLKQFPLLLPPIEIQNDFATRLSALKVSKEVFITAMHQTEALFASLQHRAFRGEL